MTKKQRKLKKKIKMHRTKLNNLIECNAEYSIILKKSHEIDKYINQAYQYGVFFGGAIKEV